MNRPAPTAPRIRCARCGRQVERVEWFDDHLTRLRVVRAYCHGDVDEMRVNLRDLTLDLSRALSEAEGVAFEKRSAMIAAPMKIDPRVSPKPSPVPKNDST
jgi:hypothetical protein